MDKVRAGGFSILWAGLCKEEACKMLFIFEVWIDSNKIPDILAVEGALFCGICKPQRQPVEMPELD